MISLLSPITGKNTTKPVHATGNLRYALRL